MQDLPSRHGAAPALHRFASPSALDERLAADVATALSEAIDLRGCAVLAVSGGRTPAALFRRLAATPIDWSRTTVTLVDERWLEPDHPDSNARLVAENLLHDKAAAARWLPLWNGAPDAAAGVFASEKSLAALPWPFDVVLLGMGNDGHTASLFPCAAETAAALDPHCPARLAVIRPATAPYPRITLTLPALAAARHLWLHIVGGTKWQVLGEALHNPSPQLPVGAVFAAARGDCRIYWSPEGA